jgi:hypothetical protein
MLTPESRVETLKRAIDMVKENQQVIKDMLQEILDYKSAWLLENLGPESQQ